jgi:hypothetical protein
VAISRAEVQSRLQPYLLVHLDKNVLDLLTNTEFTSIFNDVAKDLNEEAQLNQERWDKTGGSTHAEDAEYTNYLLQGVILRVYSFKFKDEDYAEIEMDIHYLRQCEDIDILADEIDLPNAVLTDYVELLKVWFRAQYGDAGMGAYEQALVYYGQKAQQQVQNQVLRNEGIRRNWFLLDTDDDNLYEIAGQWVGMENFVRGIADYTWVGSE